MFNSFLMGGFECSTHRDNRGRRLDLIHSTRHDEFAEKDYRRLLSIGMRTARDGVRWHLIEKEPYKYDFTSLEKQTAAVRSTGMQVVWDYFHYGYPDDLDIFSEEFIDRFARFASAVTRYLIEQTGGGMMICPVNEISFFSWIGGDKGLFYPAVKKRGDELKRQLVKAAVAAAAEIKQVCPSALIVFTDPAIHVVAKDRSPFSISAAENYRLTQFEGFDQITRDYPESIDILGLNYYFHNQWRHPSRRKISRGHREYRPLNEILIEFYERYRRPMFIAETGIEDDERPAWFRYVCSEVNLARQAGVPIGGICLYPIVNHPGWADNRRCHNGLWDYADDDGSRMIYQPLADEISAQTSRLSRSSASN